MTEFNFIDSSIWVDYFVNGKFRDIIESGSYLISSVLSILEVKKKLVLYYKLPEKIIHESLNYIKSKSLIIEIDMKIVERATEFVINKKLAMADSIIYSSALLNGAELFTKDNDFKGLPHTKVLN